jgi:hypothetical protein
MRKPESEGLLCAEVTLRNIVSRKGDNSNVISEISGTTKDCTDEQELHKRHNWGDE